jgi:hypothetical protein
MFGFLSLTGLFGTAAAAAEASAAEASAATVEVVAATVEVVVATVRPRSAWSEVVAASAATHARSVAGTIASHVAGLSASEASAASATTAAAAAIVSSEAWSASVVVTLASVVSFATVIAKVSLKDIRVESKKK